MGTRNNEPPSKLQALLVLLLLKAQSNSTPPGLAVFGKHLKVFPFLVYVFRALQVNVDNFVEMLITCYERLRDNSLTLWISKYLKIAFMQFCMYRSLQTQLNYKPKIKRYEIHHKIHRKIE